ncbi:MAG: aspartate/glutamate racemase family protein [Alphaproteobacteria bacterium]|nr:aspartate/glutamate racemase family protein [Alphaproteobacteria bacterium]MCA0448156.1 aspartate/glutamate racemase family protein [Pseudomonadota bacterium]
MRILLLNPNTTPAITDLVAREARKLAAPGDEIVPATGAFGAKYIVTRAGYAIAAHAALDAWAKHDATIDGTLLACFGDPGLGALRELSTKPVVGMLDAAVDATGGKRYAIVTGGALWDGMLREILAASGKDKALAGIRTVAPSGAEIAADPDAAIASLVEAIEDSAAKDGAECVILGGAGLAGLATPIRACTKIAIVDPLAASLHALQKASISQKAKAGTAMGTVPAIASNGLSSALAARLGGKDVD